MSTQIPLEHLTKPLLECLDEVFNQGHGYFLDKGTSLFPTLNEVSAAEASQAAAMNGATVAAHVAHAAFYLDVLDDIIRSKQITKVNWREIWETVSSVTPEEWDTERERLKQSYDRVLATINSFDKWEGEYDIGGTISVLAHTAYHLGAVRQALAVIRSRASNA
jgi:hypothetical protein